MKKMYKVMAENGVYNSRLDEKYYAPGEAYSLSDWTSEEIRYAIAAGLFGVVGDKNDESHGKIDEKQDNGDET